jgi:hypothetical protein
MVREDGSPVIIDYSRARRANAPVTADRESAAYIRTRLLWTVSAYDAGGGRPVGQGSAQRGGGKK